MNAFAKIQFFFIIALVSVVFFSCDPNEELPPETVLEYIGCQMFGDSTGISELNLQIHFQDGDGNIGVANPENHNLFIKVLDKQSETDTIYTLMQIGNLEPKDLILTYPVGILGEQNSSIKGTIDIPIQKDMGLSDMQEISKLGIIRFEIFMHDQNLVPSNTITTPDIYIR
jgi:hypothetical protein